MYISTHYTLTLKLKQIYNNKCQLISRCINNYIEIKNFNFNYIIIIILKINLFDTWNIECFQCIYDKIKVIFGF